MNTLTHADNFVYLPDQWAQFQLNNWLPDYDWDGGIWSDLADIWKVGYGGLFWGAAVNKNTGTGKGYTGGIFNLGTIIYPVMYNIGLKVLELFEINPIKGFTFRQGPEGALHVEVDASSATITAIRLKEFDSVGNTTVVATGSAPGLGPRPNYFKSALTIVDDSSHLIVYFDPVFNPLYTAAYVTATTKVLEVDSTKYATQGQMSWLWTSGNSAMVLDFISVVENYATLTPTPTPTITPTFTATPTRTATPTFTRTATATPTFIPYWTIIIDNAARPVTVDNQAREIQIDNKARTIKIRRNP
ncbi:MAG: hypothetical protein A4E67_00201 [Syntrophaceae bacterium PtaB.Bin038]|nr:MAG: hypothetical protein A4E67_00201 [Syntrophaceae bacterium PtaB.Bin038]